LNPTFAPLQEVSNENSTKKSKIFGFDDFNITCQLVIICKQQSSEEGFNYLKSLGPSAIDFEFRSIGMSENCDQHIAVLEMIYNAFQTNRDYEFLESLLNLYLKIHSDVIVANSEILIPILTKIKEVQSNKWDLLRDLFNSNFCLIKFLIAKILSTRLFSFVLISHFCCSNLYH